MWLVFAQGEWSGWVQMIGSVGFAAVVAWYLLSKAIPDMQSRFSGDLKAQRDDFQKQQEREREQMQELITLINQKDSKIISSIHEMLGHGISRQVDMQKQQEEIHRNVELLLAATRNK